LRAALHDYMQWATDEVMSYSPMDAKPPATNLPTPHWDWTGLRR
jgi:hemoglobin